MADEVLAPGRYRIEVTVTHEEVVPESPLGFLTESDLVDLAQRFGSTIDAVVERVGD